MGFHPKDQARAGFRHYGYEGWGVVEREAECRRGKKDGDSRMSGKVKFEVNEPVEVRDYELDCWICRRYGCTIRGRHYCAPYNQAVGESDTLIGWDEIRKLRSDKVRGV